MTSLQHPIFNNIDMGIGTWAWGDKLVWGFGNGYNEGDVTGAFTASIAGGIRFFDTAEVYGQGKSESILGELTQEIDHKVIIATKMMPYPWRLFNNSMRNALQNSLKRLRRQKVELYQIHMPLPPMRPEKWMDDMADLHNDGLIDAIGVSNYNLQQTIAAQETLKKRGLRLASNQVEYHLLDRRIETSGLMDYCKEEGIKVIAYSPLALGVLTGKYSAQNPPSGTRAARFSRNYLNKLQPLLNTMARIGNEHNGKTTAQVAINWVIQKGALPIPGAKNARQAGQNLGAVGWQLTHDEMLLLEEMSKDLQRSGWIRDGI
jgi:aryl-alcohol dehydrogenase-like predicted oxidoreductase